jgi:hypothetical protein
VCVFVVQIQVSSRPGFFYNELPDRWLFYLNRGTTRLNLPSPSGGFDDAQQKANAQLCVEDFKQAELLRGPLRPEAIIVENRAQAYERLGNYNLAIAGEDIVRARVRVSMRPHLRCFTYSFRFPSSRAPSVTYTRSSALLVRFFDFLP